MEIIDCHTHICPDNLAERNTEIIKRSSGITPAYDGTVGQLVGMMQKCKISKAIVNNTVLRPELMRKANDFTFQMVSKHSNMFGMAWIIPGESSSVQEVQRCKDLGFKGVKMHNSHFKILPSDSRNDKIYEKIIECRLPVLFHCGPNPYATSGQIQYAVPESFTGTINSFPEMKIILGHLAGYEDNPADSIEVMNTSRNVFADLALNPKRSLQIEPVLDQVDVKKLVFGSDYPIQEAFDILGNLRRCIDETQFEIICESNAKALFSLS